MSSTTNPQRAAIYVGMSNTLTQRLIEHYLNRGNPKTFAGRFYCYNLVYFEYDQFVDNAIAREKEIKGWSRKKKKQLIAERNPKWTFLNREIMDCLPAEAMAKAGPPKVDVYSRS